MAATSEPCPADWVQFDNHCYKFPEGTEDEWMTWDEAASHCESMDSVLPNMRSAAEEEFLREHQSRDPHRFTYWLGVKHVGDVKSLHDGSTPTESVPRPENNHPPDFCYDEGKSHCGRFQGDFWTVVNCDATHCGQGIFPVCVKPVAPALRSCSYGGYTCNNCVSCSGCWTCKGSESQDVKFCNVFHTVDQCNPGGTECFKNGEPTCRQPQAASAVWTVKIESNHGGTLFENDQFVGRTDSTFKVMQANADNYKKLLFNPACTAGLKDCTSRFNRYSYYVASDDGVCVMTLNCHNAGYKNLVAFVNPTKPDFEADCKQHVDSCIGICEEAYPRGTKSTMDSMDYYCSKGCVAMARGDILTYNSLYCSNPPNDEAECSERCANASDLPERRAACEEGCTYWL